MKLSDIIESYEGLPDEDLFSDEPLCLECNGPLPNRRGWYAAEHQTDRHVLTPVFCSKDCIKAFLAQNPEYAYNDDPCFLESYEGLPDEDEFQADSEYDPTGYWQIGIAALHEKTPGAAALVELGRKALISLGAEEDWEIELVDQSDDEGWIVVHARLPLELGQQLINQEWLEIHTDEIVISAELP
jgi:hypothetical protein